MKKNEKKKINKRGIEKDIVQNILIRRLLIIAGTFFVVMGIIGIFLPIIGSLVISGLEITLKIIEKVEAFHLK